MSQIDDLERRVGELEEKLERAHRQIGTLEVQIRELQNPKPPLGTRTPPKESGPSLSDIAKKQGGKLY